MHKYRYIITVGCIVLLASIADKAGCHVIAMVVMGCLVGHLAALLGIRAAGG
jgi:hypothetical protein